MDQRVRLAPRQFRKQTRTGCRQKCVRQLAHVPAVRRQFIQQPEIERRQTLIE
jgi:hypothetical protein